MRHDDTLYYRWLQAESRCRSLSHRLYVEAQIGGAPPAPLLREFSDAIDETISRSSAYLAHLTELTALRADAAPGCGGSGRSRGQT